MKVREAEKGTGMTETEATKYLVGSRSNMILGTVDANGNPSMQPVWYYFDPQTQKIYMYTYRKAAKASNMRSRDVVYFDVDDDRFPNKGVRGRGRAKEVSDKTVTLEILSKVRQAWPSLQLHVHRRRGEGCDNDSRDNACVPHHLGHGQGQPRGSQCPR